MSRWLEYPTWQVPLWDAILEFDAQRLPAKVQKAEKAIRDRLHELGTAANNPRERQALTDALATLEILKRR
jgi:hypothetical protein